MTETDKPWSGSTAATSSGSASGPPPTLTSAKAHVSGAAPGAGGSGVDDARAMFDKMCREIEQREKAAPHQPEQGAAVPPPFSNPTSASLQDGGPVAPDFSAMSRHFDDLQAGAQQQIRGQREKDEREAADRKAVKDGERSLTKAIVEGIGRSDEAMGALKMSAAVEAGYRQHEGEVKSGAAQQSQREDAGWREYKRLEEAGARQHQSEEERRRSSGMSI